MDLRFAQVDIDRKDHLCQAPLMVPGLYNWHLVFGGRFLEFREAQGHVADWDVILVALTTWDVKSRLIEKLKDESPGTTVIATVDYSPQLWQQAFEMEWLAAELAAADVLFAPVPVMQAWMQAIVPGRLVHLLGHPINVDKLRMFRVPLSRREESVTFLTHRYDKFWLPGLIMQRRLQFERKETKVHIVVSDPQQAQELMLYFRNVAMGGEYPNYIKWQATQKYGLDAYMNINSWGRFQADNAILEIPTVGSSNIVNQEYLWPKLSTEPGQFDVQQTLMLRLIDDPEFYRETVNYAAEAVQTLGYSARKAALLEMLEKSERKETEYVDQTKLSPDEGYPKAAEKPRA